jgi:Lipocalin-like domain
MTTLRIAALTLAALAPLSAETLEGRWKLLSAEDVRPSGEVVRQPFGAHPAGAIVVQGGFCYLQILNTDSPSFGTDSPVGDQMKATLLSSYIAYEGPCSVDAAAGSVTLKVEGAWRPDYVGTEQKRIFHFENGKLIFGTLPNTIRSGDERLTRKLTLERVR